MHPALARLLLSVAYPLLAHAASTTRDPRLAALALLDILLIVLVVPLLRRKPTAWLAVGITAAVLWWMQHSLLLPVLLLLPPVLITALLSWWFARTLRPGSVPLIQRIVGALEDVRPAELPPEIAAYTRRLTGLWAGLLGAIALVNLALGVIAVPDGMLARLGQPPLVSVPQVWWSWFANLMNYGIVGAVFVIEYFVRMRLFPDRPYTGLFDFFRRLGTLGPTFWRDVMR